LLGGVVISEWSTFLAKDAELAFCSGANLAAILAAQAAIESHLRYEYFDPIETKGWGLYRLLENVQLPLGLKSNLHKLRRLEISGCMLKIQLTMRISLTSQSTIQQS
jgi:hypothetical protein